MGRKYGWLIPGIGLAGLFLAFANSGFAQLRTMPTPQSRPGTQAPPVNPGSVGKTNLGVPVNTLPSYTGGYLGGTGSNLGAFSPGPTYPNPYLSPWQNQMNNQVLNTWSNYMNNVSQNPWNNPYNNFYNNPWNSPYQQPFNPVLNNPYTPYNNFTPVFNPFQTMPYNNTPFNAFQNQMFMGGAGGLNTAPIVGGNYLGNPAFTPFGAFTGRP